MIFKPKRTTLLELDSAGIVQSEFAQKRILVEPGRKKKKELKIFIYFPKYKGNYKTMVHIMRANVAKIIEGSLRCPSNS